MKTTVRRYRALFVVGSLVVTLASYSHASPIIGSGLSYVDLNQVAVNNAFIDMDFTGGTTTDANNVTIASSGTTVDGSGYGLYQITGATSPGDFAGLSGTTSNVGDLCNGPSPTAACPANHFAPVGTTISLPSYITFNAPAASTYTITMTELIPGDFTAAGCAGAPGSGLGGQTCTPPIPGGSPFDLTNLGTVGQKATGVGIEFDFFGTLTDPNGTAPIKGTFSTSFAGVDIQSLLAAIANNETVVSSAQGSLTVQAGVPEPNTVALVLIGGSLIGVTRIRRRA